MNPEESELIPGQIVPRDGRIELNLVHGKIELTVTNNYTLPIMVGSHYHFFEVNPALEFDRQKAYGMRLDIQAGGVVRFEPGEVRTKIFLVPIQGSKR